MITLKTFNKNTLDYDATINMVEPKNLIAEQTENFKLSVQTIARYWAYCQTKKDRSKVLEKYPHFTTIDPKNVTADEQSSYAKFVGYENHIKAYEDIQLTSDEQSIIDNRADLPIMVKFYASFVADNEDFIMADYDSIYKKCRDLFTRYVLTDTPVAMNQDSTFKALKDELVEWYNKHFELKEDTEMFTAQGSSINKVSTSFAQLLVQDFKMGAKLNKKTGYVELGTYRQMKTCKKIFRTYMLAKVQRISLDDARKTLQAAIDKDTRKEEQAVMADETVTDVVEETTPATDEVSKMTKDELVNYIDENSSKYKVTDLKKMKKAILVAIADKISK